MPLLNSLRNFYHRFTQKITEPEKAYDLWAKQYDHQPGNLMLDLDEALFTRFLETVPVTDQVVADIGCGTGRHWKKILARKPQSLLGFDVSEQMLAELQRKYPQATTNHLGTEHQLSLPGESVNLIVSTLTIAHIENISEALREWKRVLTLGGSIIITDYHPVALSKGGNRTFSHNGETVAVRNHVHSIKYLNEIANDLGLQKIAFSEQLIDVTMKSYYENKNAVSLYQKFLGTPIIYAIHLKKPDGTS